MAKGQMRSGREVRKPKKDKAAPAVSVGSTLSKGILATASDNTKRT